MTNDVAAYFQKRYAEQPFRVVPGHWPDFKTTVEVDNWLEKMNRIKMAFEAAFEEEDKSICPRCHNEEIHPSDNFCKICGMKLKFRTAVAGNWVLNR